MIWKACFWIAMGICAAMLVCAVVLWRCGKGSSKSRLYLLMGGTFVAMYLLLFPHFWESDLPVLSKLMLDLHSTAQAFTFDISIKDIVESITAREAGSFFAWYGRTVSVLAMICPLFTISFILSFVKNFWPHVRLALQFRKRVYVFPELNDKALAFAKSIAEAKKGLIVFANAYAKEETDPELLEEAKSIRAICFTRSIDHLPIKSRGRKGGRGIHFIMLEEDESAALAESLELAKKYQGRPNVRVSLLSSSPIAGKVIDSIQSASPTLSKALEEKVGSDVDAIWDIDTWKNTVLQPGRGFYMQRIDPVKNLAIQTLSDPTLIEHLRKASSADKKISLMIVGLGGIGKQLFKTAVWLYQVAGYTVEINLFDSRSDAEVRGHLKQECPEIMDNALGARPGDASYNVAVYPNTDLFSSAFEEMVRSGPDSERLQRTQAVFTTLGDDDQNINAAVRLRILFDQIKLLDHRKGDPDSPRIYSVVFHDEKRSYMDLEQKTPPEAVRKSPYKRGRKPAAGAGPADAPCAGIHNQKRQHYNIAFIGNLSSQYCLQALEATEALEREVIARHVSWMVTNYYVKKTYEENGEFRKAVDQLYRERGVSNPEISIYDPLGGADKEGITYAVASLVRDYYDYEYYRDSSVSTHLHRERFLPVFLGIPSETIATRRTSLTALDQASWDRRITEHMRWNAYMRSTGYRYGAERFDRGLLHQDLVPFEELDPVERFKD